MTTQIANNPLVIEDFPAEPNQIARGYTLKRRLIVKNLGAKKADIDIWIAATDAKSEPLLRWCSFSAETPLELKPRENREIALYFEVPPQATPGLYNYEILIEAPAQYPDKIFRRPQQIRVLRSERDAEWSNEPGFIIQPLTNSANPYPLQAGEKLALKVIVENRSKRVDRFYLNCPELTKDWFTIHYPESRIETSGVVKETDGLELNPSTNGEITLIFHPPLHTPSGNYFPTIRLTSYNKDELVLLDVAYLQILPHEALGIELHPALLRFPSEQPVFEIKLINQGNIIREIAISAGDRENLFIYTPEFTPEPIPPGQSRNFPLTVKPRKWWRRPLWGKGLEFNFDIELENNEQLILPETAKPPALPKDLPQGTLVWEPRPWWQVLLPILLLLLLLLGVISVGAFLYWQKVFVKPKISKVESTQKVYQEIYEQPIRLNLSISNLRSWELKNWKFQNDIRLSTIKIIPQNREGIGKIISYDYNQLLQYCQQQTATLTCTNLPTETKQAGNYTFKIEVYPLGQNKPSDSKETDTIIIQPVPPVAVPKIIEFYSSKLVYRETLKEQVILNWKLSNPSQIQNVTLTHSGSNASPIKKTFIQCSPQELKYQGLQLSFNAGRIEKVNNTDFLVCNGVFTNVTNPGDYTFKLEVFSKQNPKQPSDTKQTDTITIKPVPIPKIIDKVSSNKVVYEYNEPIFLNWRLSEPAQIAELRIIQQGSDGAVAKTILDLRQCRTQISTPEIANPAIKPEAIACQNIRIAPPKAGTYNYKIEVVSKQDPNQPSDLKETDTITVKPIPSPQIIDQVSTNKAVYEYNEPIFLNWRLSDPAQIEEMRIIQQGSDGSVAKTTLSPRQCQTQISAPEVSQESNFIKNNPTTSQKIIICQNIRIAPPKAGNYNYKIEVFSKQYPNQPANYKETSTITIKPLPVPKITQILSTKPFYEAAKNEEIYLNWEISNANQVRDLKLISLAPDGSVNSELKRYIIINNSLPPQLKNFCTLTTNLVCRGVPSGAKQAGDYTFKLTVISKQGSEESEITKNTPTVKIKPVPPKPATPVKIIYFKVNGQDVTAKPKFIYEINKQRKPVDIILSWQVEDGEDIKVELMPFGDVQKPQGSKIYTLSKPPSSVTITLKVTNKAGEQTTQSVAIETAESTRSDQIRTSSPKGTTPGETKPGEIAPQTASPLPTSPFTPSPIELPPN